MAKKNKRKSVHQLASEYEQGREHYNKIFHHKKSKEDYQLLYPAWDEKTNEKLAVYALCAMSRLKFSRPFDEFLEKFEEGPYARSEG